MTDEFDCIGREVPERVAKSFAYRRRLIGLCFRIQSLKDEFLHTLDDSNGQEVNQEIINRTIEVLTDEVMNNIPGFVCPVHPHPSSCSRCKGRKWLSQNQYEMTSQRDHPSISPES